MITTIIFFILLLAALILVHEWGHFFTARKFGVKVEEFAFGFPPRLASFVRNGTRYVFNLLPLGGYVKIYGESGEHVNSRESFSSRPIWQRLAIIVAGVVMNLVLAWVLFSLGHAVGLPTVVGEGEASASAKVTIVGVSPDSPAEKAGLRFGDAIQEIKARDTKFKVASPDEVYRIVSDHRGEEIILIVARGREITDISVMPRGNPPAGEGPLGIAMAKVGVVRSPWYRAPWDGLKTTASATVAIVQALGHIVADFISKGEVSAEVSGPVGIFVFASQTQRLGLIYLVELAGILSVNLALLNILPFPALDGGRVLFLFIEKVRGAKLNPRLEQIAHTVGFVILSLLIIYITQRDIVRFF